MTDTSLIVLSTGLLNFLLASLILVRNPRSRVNQTFGVFALAIIAWTTFNYLADFSASFNLLFTRLTFVAAILIAASIYHLSNIFPSGKPLNRGNFTYFQIIFAVVLIAGSLTPLLVPDVTKSSNGVELTIGALYPLYIAYVLQAFLFVITNFMRKYRKTTDLLEKNQIRLLLAGISVYAALAISSNLIVPLLVNNWSSSQLGPVFTLIFVGFTAYAIARHRLLDIRLIVARSVGYLTSLAVIATIYGVLVFGVTKIVFDLHLSLAEEVFIAVATALACLTFGRVKAFFDRITNKFFFRDAYDAQTFLDEFNKTLVASYELNQLLKGSLTIIEQNIKPAHSLFVASRSASHHPLMVGSHARAKLKEDTLHAIRGEMNKLKEKVVVVDELENTHDSLKKQLRDHDVVMAVRLAPNASNARRDIGYLLLGPKKSGNIYSSQDVRVMEIIANELVIAVQNALRFEEIEHFNITLQQRVEEATKKLRKANEKLRELDETKDDFISMASHQLRTPLTSVKGYISMIMEGDAGKVTHMQREMLGQAFFSSQRMVYLIADLLNVSRLKTGKFVIEPTPVNLADIVEQELGQLEETATARSLKLTYDKPKDFPLLMLDEVKIRQVIMNFVDNAIYYTPAKGQIDVQLLDKGSTVELRVTDDGIGVPKSEQPHLFTKFYRAGNARKARPDGTGLGLFMAKKVVVSQEGSIIFESKEGKGSTFGFIFSKHKLAPPKTAIEPTPDKSAKKHPEPAAKSVVKT